MSTHDWIAATLVFFALCTIVMVLFVAFADEWDDE